MNIGVLSDTHGYLDSRIFKYFDKCDEIWHAGDIGDNVLPKLNEFKPTRAVSGNIDNKNIGCITDNIFKCEGLKTWLTHIGGRPPYYNNRIIKNLPIIKPDILVCGHSHILHIQKDHSEKLLYINPGAAGKRGIHKVSTLVRFKVSNTTISDMEVIELAPDKK